ncbi:MAG TPA: hypothetical protein VFA68_04460 [Terriglobales bacterium]|nr:hypothetical protein [Terriglobales bacterium]
MKPFAAALVLVSCMVFAQRHGDPLTTPEIDQLRDTAQEPELRLKLYVQFTRARLDALTQAQNDPKVTDRGQAIHDKLQDFLDIYDELDDNVDMYADRRNDIRKPLKLVIGSDTEFQTKLRAFKDAAVTAKEEFRQYEFLLSNALDAVGNGLQDHRQLLSEQEEAAKNKRLIKPK